MDNTTESAQRVQRSDDLPAFRRYKVSTDLCSLQALPFVDYPNGITGDGASHWRVAPTDSPAQAFYLGRSYALHLAQYLKDNPLWNGSAITAKIWGAIGVNGGARPDDYLMGFCSVFEQLLSHGVQNLDIEAMMNDDRTAAVEG